MNSHSLRENYYGAYTQGYWIKEPILGIRPKSNITVDSKKNTKTGETIYQVHYSIDSNCRRVTPQKNENQKNRFALFFGCSFIFGDGLNDDQTLPFYFAEECPSYRVYNYAFSAWGPQQMLEILKQRDFGSDLLASEGVLIYSYIDPHVDRAIGSMIVTANWGIGFPYYVLTPSGKLKRHDNFASGRPELSYFYTQLADVPSVKLFALDLPLWKSSYDFELVAAMICESRKFFKQRFPNGKFIVHLYPGTKTAAILLPYLEKEKISTIDLSNLNYLRSGKYIIHVQDPHPSQNANQELAKIFRQKLGL